MSERTTENPEVMEAADSTEFAPPNNDSSVTHARQPVIQKRKIGAGEVIFNFGTYGGVAFIVNEILSTLITNTIKPKNLDEGLMKDGPLFKGFTKTVDFMHGKLNPLKVRRHWYDYAATMFVMCMGGNLLVPAVKYLEDRKGKIVRGLDLMIHGREGEQDPGLQQAHTEMDNAPKQSWGSLWKGRLLVLSSAIGMNLVMGGEESPSTKWLANTPLKKYSNTERIGVTFTRDMLSRFHPNAEIRQTIKEFRAQPYSKIHANEGKVAQILGGTFGFVMIVSAAMAVLFYASSHLFAALRDNKKARQAEQPQKIDIAIAHPAVRTREEADKETEKTGPKPTISAVAEHAMLSHEPQVQVGA